MPLKRPLMKTYINVNPDAVSGSENWVLIGNGFSTLSISTNPETQDTHYINAYTGTTTHTGYKPTATLEAWYETKTPSTKAPYDLDLVVKFLDKIKHHNLIAQETKILIVDAYNGTQSDATSEFTLCPARMQTVNLQIDEYGGSGEDPLALSAQINFKNDPVKYTCTVSYDGTTVSNLSLDNTAVSWDTASGT